MKSLRQPVTEDIDQNLLECINFVSFRLVINSVVSYLCQGCDFLKLTEEVLCIKFSPPPQQQPISAALPLQRCLSVELKQVQ